MLEHTVLTLTRLRAAVLPAVVCAVSLLAAGLAGAGWHQREDLQRAAQARRELLVQLLLTNASHQLDASAALLQAAAPGAAAGLPLPQVPAHVPFVRSLAVVDGQGRVLASTRAEDLGLRLPDDLRDALPPPGREQLLAMRQGLYLDDMIQTAAGQRPLQQDAMMPLARRLPGAAPRWLLATVSPGALLIPPGAERLALPGLTWLAKSDGQLLIAHGPLHFAEGQRLPPFSEHPVFQPPRALLGDGSYLGRGLGPSEMLQVSFRRAQAWPLVMVQEQPLDEVLAGWRSEMLGLLLVFGLVAGLLAAGGLGLRRSLSARIQAVQALQRAHEQMARSEGEMRVLLQSVQELIFRTDVQGRITFVNASWEQQARERIDSVMGRRLQDLVVPADRDAVAALFWDPGAGRRVEVSAMVEGASLRRYIVAVVPLHDRQGLAGFAGSAVDVTERHQAEQAMQHQHALTELLLEISPSPVSMVDDRGRYVVVNRAWEEFTGRARLDVIGAPVGHFLPEAEQRVHEREDRRLRAEGGRLSYETEFTLKDGSRHDMLVTKVAVPGAAQGMAGILSTLVDVTEFRRAERLTREARDVAEEASRAKTEFIANVSHELRTPLQSILGFSELGLARSREHARFSGMFGDIHAAGQRMLAMVNDLLDVAKIESPVGTFHLERCDLRQPIQDVVQELGPQLAQRHLQLHLDLPTDRPLDARVDPLRFQQAVRNVLANAIRFSPEGGRLDLRAGTTAQGEFHLCVADRGPGIPEGEHERIFDAFIQSSATQTGAGGTGLGLAITRKILEIHGGRIHARDRLGGGAEFHLHLPPRARGDTGDTGDTGLGDLTPL